MAYFAEAPLRKELIRLLDEQDPVGKADVSNRAEGIFQAIGAYGRTFRPDLKARGELVDAIVRACIVYKQVDGAKIVIDGTKATVPWPTNRYALRALADLNWATPTGLQAA
ncbi:hypothetical protein A2763_04100 [Candidatus Kaiserbacteria bacterium RIFCSPHIGHO2_01_FULL_54_36]|uniref:Uncharacterized protein n=1 Tax=Candidatus Kaiserbacteria bacterium RIFCSPHIGHO2_01_FULL_54_36 TaxID=1798482 RepID=A0A1F6CK52_9BACT|nr:MAG: hypothetical protein A2763_04100 [Candidatus Kaiserbacteria bacterium RIFCSPHIGHO2_01_FULL_54_36]OGG75661.1 MAG: hypothetical protein A3A41_00910 [Candidatus Kaiserbacteria bacterium RIFCSPLOWO2_01_FULL_54_22]